MRYQPAPLRCPVCGAGHATCGGPTDTVPVDFRIGAASMAPALREYRVRRADGKEYTARLSEDDAKRLRAVPIGKPTVTVKARQPANKAR